MSLEQPVAVALMIIFALIAIAAPLVWMGTQKLWRSYGLWLGVIVVAVFAVIFGIGMGTEWQGAQLNGCIDAAGGQGECYCENQDILTQPAAVKQPSNTLTAYFPIFAGLFILGYADVDRLRRGGSDNPMKAGGYFPIAFGLAVVLLGVGSMFFHASMTEFLGALDPVSISLFMVFVLVYDLWRVINWPSESPYSEIAHLVLWLVLTGVTVFTIYRGFTDATSMAVIAIVGLVELVIGFSWYRGGLNGVKRLPGWIFSIACVFVLAVIFWTLSQTGAQLCDQGSVLQGHGLWHLLSMAVAPLLFFFEFRSETRS